jgi:ketosteroid isomerase-like protein
MNEQFHARTLRETIAGLSTKMLAKDMSIADEFEADATLVGSEPGEIARSGEAIQAFFASIFSQPYTVTWRWDMIDVATSGDIGWCFAEGAAVITTDGKERHVPYRLSGVLSRSHKGWRWRLFHGSEPKV